METYTEIKSGNRIIKVTYADWEIGSAIMAEWDRHLTEMGILISPYERHSSDLGAEDIATGLDNWEEDYNRIATELDDAIIDHQSSDAHLEHCLSGCNWDYSNEGVLSALEGVRDSAEYVAQCTEELATHIGNRPDVKVIEFCPYVDLIRYFRVSVDVWTYEKYTGQNYNEDDVIKTVEAFNAAYRGGVYSILIEDEEGNDIDSVSGVTFRNECPADDEILEYVSGCM